MRKLVAIAALMFTACNSGGGGDSTVATPTFSPTAATYATVENVTIACATAGAIIYLHD